MPEPSAAGAADAGVADYDRRLAAYDAPYGREGTWSERVLSLAGRARMREALANPGWPSR